MSIKINENFSRIGQSYLFSEIASRVSAYSAAHPDAKIIRMGIGDVTQPLASAVVAAMEKASAELGDAKTFRGYPPEYGYDFLREAISGYYAGYGVTVAPTEIFVSDGAKSDVGNIVDILGNNPVLLPDPVYPVYHDSNVMQGNSIDLIDANEDNGFLPPPPADRNCSGVIYLCSPNNPTGAVYSLEQLKEWVDYANRTGSIIIFDSAYESYISGDYPHSIYAVEGARTCAVEVCSFSKMAGFTGTRCETVRYYMGNAALLAELFRRKKVFFTGGDNSPYIWMRNPFEGSSWDLFDKLLNEAQIVGTPGSGFGRNGEGYFRFTAFGSRENTIEAVARLDKLL